MFDKVGTPWHVRSLQSSPVRPQSQSLSEPRVQSTHAPSLVSVGSEDPAPSRSLNMEILTGQNLRRGPEGTQAKHTHEFDDSIESGIELIVRTDSH